MPRSSTLGKPSSETNLGVQATGDDAGGLGRVQSAGDDDAQRVVETEARADRGARWPACHEFHDDTVYAAHLGAIPW
jgi:hypothetical protein